MRRADYSQPSSGLCLNSRGIIPIYGVWYIGIFQIPLSFSIWFIFPRLPLLFMKASYNFEREFKKKTNQNPTKQHKLKCSNMERFVLCSVCFWVRLQVTAKESYLILLPCCPLPGEGMTLMLVSFDEATPSPCLFLTWEPEDENKAQELHSTSCSSMSLCRDTENKAQNKVWHLAAGSSPGTKSTCTAHGWGGQPALRAPPYTQL